MCSKGDTSRTNQLEIPTLDAHPGRTKSSASANSQGQIFICISMHSNHLLYTNNTIIYNVRSSVLFTFLCKRCNECLVNSSIGLLIHYIQINSRGSGLTRGSIKLQHSRGVGQKYYFLVLLGPVFIKPLSDNILSGFILPDQPNFCFVMRL
jgi:hypothetical protein